MKKRWGMGLLLVSTLALGLSRDPSENVTGKTFQECFQAATARSETIAMDKDAIRQAEDNYRQAIGSVLPNVSGSGQYEWTQNANRGGFNALYPNPTTNTKLTLTQPLFQGFKEFGGLKQTKQLVGASHYDAQQALTQLYQDVAQSYYTVLSQEQDIDDINEELGYYQSRIKELKQFASIGRAQTTDVLTAESQQAALIASLKSEQGTLRAQRAVLAFLTGFDPEVALARPVPGNENARPLNDYLTNLAHRPDVLADEARVQAADASITVARAGHLPTVNAQGDYFLERSAPLNEVKWDALLTFSLPIFSGGIVSAQVDQAHVALDTAQYHLSQTKRLAEQQIRQYFETFHGDKDTYQAYQTTVDLAEKNYKEETKYFRSGLVTNLDVLTALTTFEESRRSLDRSGYSMRQDIANLEAAAAFQPQVTTSSLRER